MVYIIMCCLLGLRDDKGESPLDIALNEKEIEAAHYLISCGGGSSKDHAKLLFIACKRGQLDVVMDVIEKCNADPKSKYL